LLRLGVAVAVLASVGGGGWLERVRPRIAADLYHKGLARRILVSQTVDALKAPLSGISIDAELNRAALLKLGVPAGAIENFGVANANTRDEAVALRKWAVRNGATRVIVPSEIFSARRVRWIFHRELSGTNVTVEVPSFEPPGYTAGDWWRTESGMIAFQNEVVKYIFYRLNY